MAVLTQTDTLTALERVNRSSDNQDARRIIECMRVTNEMLLDAPTMEANERTSNRTVQRTALPTVTHRVYNAGVGNSASQTKPVNDVLCEVAGYSEVDVKLVREAANPEEFLNGEVASFIEAIGQQQAKDLIYGNHSADNANMDGLAIRRNSIDAKYCINAGGTDTTSNTSLYIVKWGVNKAHLIYPKGSASVGVSRQDMGEVTVDKGDGLKMQAYRNYFSASYGLTLRDPKALVRIANINPASMDGEELIKLILRAKHYLATGDGTIAIYANSDVLSLMDAATVDKSNVVYNAQDPWGNDLIKIRDMRLRQVDAILSTEDIVA